MESVFGTALWRQFGAALDMLDRAVTACPESLWTEKVWPETPPEWFPRCFAEFWYVVYHSLIWLDIYLAGLPEDEFSPPPPFLPGEIDSPGSTPEQPYPKEVLREYLLSLRARCRDDLMGFDAAESGRHVEYGWTEGEAIPYAELLLYNLRHLQGHAAQLDLFLGQHGGQSQDWVTRAT